MKLASCISCGRPVLEIEGQFEKLDSFYIVEGQPDPETAGYWHATCLAASEVAPAWFEARLRNWRDVRRYGVERELASWTVLEHQARKELIAFGHRGELLNLTRLRRGKARAVAGGFVCPVTDAEYNLHLEGEPALAKAIQEGLTTTGRYPLMDVLEGLGIVDRVVHPVALDGAAFGFDRAQQRFWMRDGVTASLQYGVFVPGELFPASQIRTESGRG